MTEHAAVLFANEAFYLAFASRDMPAMEDVWATDISVTCIHPGWDPLVGWNDVMESWMGILSNPESPDITCANAKAYIHGAAAYVICNEVLPGGFLLATNIFVRQDGTWKLIHHQAGASPPPETTEDDDETAETLQ